MKANLASKMVLILLKLIILLQTVLVSTADVSGDC